MKASEWKAAMKWIWKWLDQLLFWQISNDLDSDEKACINSLCSANLMLREKTVRSPAC